MAPGLGTGADVLSRLLHARYVVVVEGLQFIAVGVGDLKGCAGDVAEKAQSLAVVAKVDLQKSAVRYLATFFSIFRVCFSVVAEDSARQAGANPAIRKVMAMSIHKWQRRERRIQFIRLLQEEENINFVAIGLDETRLDAIRFDAIAPAPGQPRPPAGGFTIALCMQLDGEPEAEEHYERHIERVKTPSIAPAAEQLAGQS